MPSLSITFQGRNVNGMSLFTCILFNRLCQYATDARGREAKRAARAYFANLKG